MPPVLLLPDTAVLLQHFANRRAWPIYPRLVALGRILISSIVVFELLAAARSREEARDYTLMAERAALRGRLLTPTHEDWVRAGQLFERRSRLAGRMQPRDHLADLLILLTAARVGGAVLTTNVRHFEAWAEVARASDVEVGVIPFATAAT